MSRYAEGLLRAEEEARIIADAIRAIPPPVIELPQIPAPPPSPAPPAAAAAVPTGAIQPYRELVTYDSPLTITAVSSWWSVYIFNEGPDPVDTYVNGREYSFRLDRREDRRIAAAAPTLNEIHVTVEEGDSATVKIDTMR